MSDELTKQRILNHITKLSSIVKETMYIYPYEFDTPIPTHFRKIGWMNNPKTAAFLSWIFSICSPEVTKTYIGTREVTLDPYEFLFTRSLAMEKCGLTDYEIRRQIDRLEDNEYVHKTPKSLTSQFTVYKWSSRLFSSYERQGIATDSTKLSPSFQPIFRQGIAKDSPQISDQIPVDEHFLMRKRKQYSEEEVESACQYYKDRFFKEKYPKPSNPVGWFNDCLRRKYWREE